MGSLSPASGIRQAAQEPAALDVAPPESWIGQAWRRFRHNGMAVASLGLMLLSILAAVFAPLITPYDPIHFTLTGHKLLLDVGPSPAHWLGTDALGRDVFSRLIYGMRAPLAVAIPGAVLCTVIGGLIGVLSGYYGGLVDEVLVRITEFIFVVPGFLMLILTVALFGNALNGSFGPYGRLILITLFIATDNWPIIMRLSRGEALRLREMQFVEAATVAGTRPLAIVRHHLLRNMLGILLVQGSFMVGNFVFVTAVLSLFGLGTPGDWPDVGAMLIEGASIWVLNPIELIAPAIVVTVLIVAPTFVGDGLRDAFDSRA